MPNVWRMAEQHIMCLRWTGRAAGDSGRIAAGNSTGSGAGDAKDRMSRLAPPSALTPKGHNLART